MHGLAAGGAIRALLAILGLSLGLLTGGATASADSGSLPKCEDLLHGPPKEVAASKTVDATTVNADGSVTMAVTVSWSFAVNAKPGEKIFDCVWDGQPGQGSVVGSTGHPGTDCSQQGLPCRFTVTTGQLSPGSHSLCDIAKILGTWPMPNPGDGPSPSGSRTPSVCVTVQIPSSPGQAGSGNGGSGNGGSGNGGSGNGGSGNGGSGYSGSGNGSSGNGGTRGQGQGTASAQAAASASGQSTPGLPATGGVPVDVPLLAGSLAGGCALILCGVFLVVRPYWKGA